ncbi:MAG: hypothetical protein JWO54_479 [Candidatus Saccharibacteria bacterium]|nr:hypothetical protein [Candidatus Saccharibacteria bacterium]MDB5180719.1 hypothetical protein [Candidatus Saccharibacteria bacterium]
MNKLTLSDFNFLLSETPIKPRLKNELRFVTSTENMSDEEWNDRELLSITDRNGNKGVLLISIDDNLYILPYEFKAGITSLSTGRSQSIICDFCQTWQYGNKAGSISFSKDRVSSISYLCCGDLKCSMHVRNKTSAAHTSRAQLREDLSIEQRIERLNSRMKIIVSGLPLEPVHLSM